MFQFKAISFKSSYEVAQGLHELEPSLSSCLLHSLTKSSLNAAQTLIEHQHTGSKVNRAHSSLLLLMYHVFDGVVTGIALARLMVSELAMHNKRAFEMKKEECFAFLEIKRREVECGERELVLHNYRQRQEHIRFYMQPYDHLTVDALNHLEALRAEIKAK
ncbi:hypothetical protein Tco_1335141 [Tanacetum coccineum]